MGLENLQQAPNIQRPTSNVQLSVHRKQLMMSIDAETENGSNRLTENIRLRIPKVALQAEAGEDGTHLIGLRTSRVLL
jgi:hypothetical protein